MYRAAVPPAFFDSIAAASVALPVDVAHRFARVLRLAAGDPIEIFDGGGRVAHGRFAPPDRIEALTVGSADDTLPPLVIVQAMIKADKLEEVVKKGTELGCSRLVLFDAERSQIHLDDTRADKRKQRMVRVAQDAVRQCGRARVPLVDGPLSFQALLDEIAAFAGSRVMGVIDASIVLSTALAANVERTACGVLVVVGPEGGLSPREVDALTAAGVVGVRLGAHVLRTETAALAALACAQVSLGQL